MIDKKIKLYNSLSNKIEIFNSLIPNKVSIYVCGPTVYDSLHIGNIRPIICFDVLRRLFLFFDYDVKYVSNFTDIDDKIINKAIAENKKEQDITKRYISEAKKNIENTYSLLPTLSPCATEYINNMVDYIDNLIKNNHAYVLDGDVFFKVKSIDNYGCLSNIKINKLKINKDKNINTDIKKDPLDFVLWKKTNIGINWNSPWSKGRPGWHTECCTIIDTIFKKQIIDIHAGGFDLKFPHHENEIAQCKATNKHCLANYWLHNGFITLNGEKMSKSLNNNIFVKDILKKYDGNILRLALLSSHYRAPIIFSENVLLMAKNQMKKIASIYNKLVITLNYNNISKIHGCFTNINHLKNNIDKEFEDFIMFLNNDLNTANAITCLFSFLKKINNVLQNLREDVCNKEILLPKLSNYLNQINVMFYLLGLNLNEKK